MGSFVPKTKGSARTSYAAYDSSAPIARFIESAYLAAKENIIMALKGVLYEVGTYE